MNERNTVHLLGMVRNLHDGSVLARSHFQERVGVELKTQGRGDGFRTFLVKSGRQLIRRHGVVRRPIDPQPDLECVDTAARAAPRPDDVTERAQGEGLLVEVQKFFDPRPGKHPMQHAVTAQEGGLAGTVLAHEQRDGPQAAALFVLKAAHVLQDQLSRAVHDESLLHLFNLPAVRRPASDSGIVHGPVRWDEAVERRPVAVISRPCPDPAEAASPDRGSNAPG